MQPFVSANQFIAEFESWHQATFLEPEDGIKHPRKEDAFDGGKCNHVFGKAGSGSVTPLESPLCFRCDVVQFCNSRFFRWVDSLSHVLVVVAIPS